MIRDLVEVTSPVRDVFPKAPKSNSRRNAGGDTNLVEIAPSVRKESPEYLSMAVGEDLVETQGHGLDIPY